MKKTLFAAVLALVLPALVHSQPTPGACGCMDIVFVVDDTGSMATAMRAVEREDVKKF